MSTRTSLTGQPPLSPTHLTHAEQLQGRIDLPSAYYRDYAVDICNHVGAMAGEGFQARGIPAHGRSFFKCIQDYVATKVRCGRGDDVVTGAYNMPKERSARPSAAPSSRPSEARTSTTTTLPRHDSSLPLHRSPSVQLRQGQTSQEHGTGLDSMPEQTIFPNPNAYTGHGAYTLGEGSQPYVSTRGISMPEETRVPETYQYGAQWPYTTGEGSQQEIADRTWDDEDTQRGLNTGILRASHDHDNTVTGLVTDFFGDDVIGPSYIPPESQPYTYNFASGSQYGL